MTTFPTSGKQDEKYGISSFFTGAGFLDLGFEDAGFVPMMANEIDKNFSRVYLYAHEQMKRPLQRFGLQTGDVCAYLEDENKRRELRKRIRDAHPPASSQCNTRCVA